MAGQTTEVGTDGFIDWDTIETPGTINVFAWEFTVTRDMHNDDNFVAAGAGANADAWLGGMSQIVGVARGRVDSSQIPGISTMATEGSYPLASIILYWKDTGASPASRSVRFDGLITDVNVVVEKTGMATVDVSFVSGAGEPTFDVITG